MRSVPFRVVSVPSPDIAPGPSERLSMGQWSTLRVLTLPTVAQRRSGLSSHSPPRSALSAAILIGCSTLLARLRVYLRVCLPERLCACLPGRLFICLLVCLSAGVFVCLLERLLVCSLACCLLICTALAVDFGVLRFLPKRAPDRKSVV